MARSIVQTLNNAGAIGFTHEVLAYIKRPVRHRNRPPGYLSWQLEFVKSTEKKGCSHILRGKAGYLGWSYHDFAVTYIFASTPLV